MRASLERALEERRDDGLHAVRLDLGEGPVLPRESGLGKTATHDRRDAALDICSVRSRKFEALGLLRRPRRGAG